MANVSIVPVKAVLNAATTAAGASVTSSDTGVITHNATAANHTEKDQAELRGLVLYVTGSGAGTLTVLAGNNPPANAKVEGDLTVNTINGTVVIALEGSRFTQTDGTVKFTSSATVNVRAVRAGN